MMDRTQLHEQNIRRRSLVHYGLARALAKKDFGHAGAEEVKAVLTQRIGSLHPHINALVKAAIPIGNTTHADWASALVDSSFSDAYMARENPLTVFGAMADSLRRVPFRSFVPTVQTGSTAEWKGSGKPAVVSSMIFDRISLAETTVAVINVITEELARNPNPVAVDLISNDQVTAVAERLNESFLSFDAAIVDVQPAGLRNGVTAVGSGSPGSLDLDLIAELILSVRDGNGISLFFVASRSGLLVLARQRSENGSPLFPNINLTTGGDILGIPVIISKAAGGDLILIDAAAIAFADGGVEISPSAQSAIQMDDSPTDGPANLVSLWQTNSIALRASRMVNWQKGYSDAVAYLSLEGGSPS